MRNVRLALRRLFRTPVVTTVAVLSLALGIGANTAIFSVTDQVLLRPLPVPVPSQLVNLSAPGPKTGGSRACGMAGSCEDVFSYPMFKDLERGQDVLSGLAAHLTVGTNLAVRGQALTGQAALVSGSYFPTLGLRPALGRLLGPEDDATVGAGYVAVLSYAFWHGRLGADSSVLGRTMDVNGQPMAVVGVAPPGFEGTTAGVRPLVFVPLSMSQTLSGEGSFTGRRDYWLYLFGRLKPGVTLARARSALNGIYGPILSDVEAPLQTGMSAAEMAQFKARRLGVFPGARGQSRVRDLAKPALAMLFGVTGVVLLIACANIANLLLALGAGRAREMGARLALGASRGQLVVQLLTESVVLALMGGAASLWVADLTLRLLASLLPAQISGVLQLTLPLPVLVFAGGLAVLTGLLFGLFPALHNTRADLIGLIRSGAAQLSGHRGAARFRASLVTVQLVLASALLIVAGLFLKSLVNVSHVDLGVRVDDLVTFAISPERSGYDSARSALLFQQVEEGLARLPGVTGVTSAVVPVLSSSFMDRDVNVEGYDAGPGADRGTALNEVGPGYFRTLGIPVLAGRAFTAADALGSAPVAVVNQAFARKFHLGADPVHRYLSFGGSDSLDVEIVGLVADAKYNSVKDPVPPLAFTPWGQNASVGSLAFYVRSAAPAAQLFHTIPALLLRLAPNVPLEELKTMPQQVRENEFLDRMTSLLSAVFASLATLLAAVGLYGVMAYTVQQRTREIGIRMALGADAWSVRALVGRQMATVIGIGGAVGVAVALTAGRLLQSLLYGLKGDDLVVFALSVAILAAVALVATWVPVRRATRVDPVGALRSE
jgi:predicted permease